VSTIVLSCIVFACVCGAALLALVLGRVLPEHHLRPEAKDAVKQGLVMIATLAALVLGLLVAAAKGTYDTQNSAVKQLSASVLLLDRTLSLYGPETKEARALLREATAAMLERIWPEDGARAGSVEPGEARAQMEVFYDKVATLKPHNETQGALKARALAFTADLAQTRLRLFANRDSSIPGAFLVVLVFWLAVLFAGYGLLAPPNATVVAVLIVCALSVSTAIFLILELDRPFEGIMRVSSAPLRDVLSLLGT
jgi:hypothetical protein